MSLGLCLCNVVTDEQQARTSTTTTTTRSSTQCAVATMLSPSDGAIDDSELSLPLI